MAADMGTERTEIAAYNGYLKSLARGIACPINTAVLEMMNTMNEQKRSPSREVLADLRSTLGMGGNLSFLLPGAAGLLDLTSSIS